MTRYIITYEDYEKFLIDLFNYINLSTKDQHGSDEIIKKQFDMLESKKVPEWATHFAMKYDEYEWNHEEMEK